jgi:hypothetical protein
MLVVHYLLVLKLKYWNRKLIPRSGTARRAHAGLLAVVEKEKRVTVERSDSAPKPEDFGSAMSDRGLTGISQLGLESPRVCARVRYALGMQDEYQHFSLDQEFGCNNYNTKS